MCGGNSEPTLVHLTVGAGEPLASQRSSVEEPCEIVIRSGVTLALGGKDLKQMKNRKIIMYCV